MTYGRNQTPSLAADGTTDYRRVDSAGATVVSVSGTANVNTELPTAATLADGTANPSTTNAAAYNFVFNGTTWDRLPGSTAAGASVTVLGGGIHVGATTTSFTAINADQIAAVAPTAGLRIVGFMLAEQAAATAEFRIMHGATVGGATNLYTVKLAAGQSTSEWMGPGGVACPNGITIDRVSGTADVVLFTKVVA